MSSGNKIQASKSSEAPKNAMEVEGTMTGNSFEWKRSFIFVVFEVRKKVLTFRDIMDFPPCDASRPLLELVMGTAEDLHKLFPNIVPSFTAEMNSVDQAFLRLYYALKTLEDSWAKTHRWIAFPGENTKDCLENLTLEQLGERVVAKLDHMINVVKKMFDLMDEDEKPNDEGMIEGTIFGDILTECYSDNKNTFPSPNTLISSPPEPMELDADVSDSPSLPPPQKIQALEKPEPADTKVLSSNMTPASAQVFGPMEEISKVAEETKNAENQEVGKEVSTKITSEGQKDFVESNAMPEARVSSSFSSPPPTVELPPSISTSNSCPNQSHDPPNPPPSETEQVLVQSPPISQRSGASAAPPPSPPPPPTVSLPSSNSISNGTGSSTQPQPPNPPPSETLQVLVPSPPISQRSGASAAPPPPTVSLPQSDSISTGTGSPNQPQPPNPPPSVPVSVQPPPMAQRREAAPPPPPPPIAPSPPSNSMSGGSPKQPQPPNPPPSGTAPVPPPPISQRSGASGAPPPPPPVGAGKSLRPRKANTKLKRSSHMGNLYRVLKAIVEGSSLNGKVSRQRKDKAGGSGASGGGKQGMADALAEMTKRSAYFQQIEADVLKHEKTIKEIRAAINSFQTKDVTELIKFHKYVEQHLEQLTDETQVLARFEGFPGSKLESLRMAAALYSKMEGMFTTLENWKVEPPLGQLLSKVETYFDKIKGEVENLDRTKDEESKRLQAHKISFDINLVLIRVKEAMVDVSSSCMEIALKERKEAKEAASKESGPKTENQTKASKKMLWRAFQLAYRVYGFAGGQDDRAEELSHELAQEIKTSPE